jgi:hypothetical protein
VYVLDRIVSVPTKESSQQQEDTVEIRYVETTAASYSAVVIVPDGVEIAITEAS